MTSGDRDVGVVVHTIVNPGRGVFCALALGFDACLPVQVPKQDPVLRRFGTPYHRFSFEVSAIQAYMLGRDERGFCDITVETAASIKPPSLFESDPDGLYYGRN